MIIFLQINASSTEDGVNIYDSGHRFEHPQLLLILLRSLPFASKALQKRALQVYMNVIAKDTVVKLVLSLSERTLSMSGSSIFGL